MPLPHDLIDDPQILAQRHGAVPERIEAGVAVPGGTIAAAACGGPRREEAVLVDGVVVGETFELCGGVS